jgi:hypothetical protein
MIFYFPVGICYFLVGFSPTGKFWFPVLQVAVACCCDEARSSVKKYLPAETKWHRI